MPAVFQILGLLTLLTLVTESAPAPPVKHAFPQIDGDWWPVAGNPDLGDYASDKQQPVDFAIWQAADGTWQIWSCIRNTKCGGKTRLFYRWEGNRPTDSHWKPMGIAMEADPTAGETEGGLQAPYVFKEKSRYFMVYGDWRRICLATSEDGKAFNRVLNQRGQPDLFSGPYEGSRDPTIIKVGGRYHCYYMGQKPGATYESAIFCRTSHDLEHWSEAMMVSAGGIASAVNNRFGDAECPFVVARHGLFYLFRTQAYGRNNLNTQYASPNPLSFGVGDDRYRIGTLPVAAPEVFRYKRQWYIAALNPALDGIRIARLRWVKN